MEPVIFAVAVGALQSGEQVFLHDVQMLKHGAFGLGRVALDDCFENLLVPAPGHLVAFGSGQFLLRVVEKASSKKGDGRRDGARFVDLRERWIMRGFCQGVMEQCDWDCRRRYLVRASAAIAARMASISPALARRAAQPATLTSISLRNFEKLANRRLRC